MSSRRPPRTHRALFARNNSLCPALRSFDRYFFGSQTALSREMRIAKRAFRSANLYKIQIYPTHGHSLRRPLKYPQFDISSAERLRSIHIFLFPDTFLIRPLLPRRFFRAFFLSLESMIPDRSIPKLLEIQPRRKASNVPDTPRPFPVHAIHKRHRAQRTARSFSQWPK